MTKHITRTFALAAAILLSSIAASAQDCSDVKEKKDAFKNEVVKKAALNIGPAAWRWQMMLEQHGETYNLGLRIVQSGDIRYTIKQGEKIQLKLEDGNVVEIEANNDYLPVATVSGGAILTGWLPMGDTDLETMKKLAKSPITDVRVVLQGTEVLLPKVKGKQANNIMAAAGCIAGIKN